jgi:hypothetical protein
VPPSDPRNRRPWGIGFLPRARGPARQGAEVERQRQILQTRLAGLAIFKGAKTWGVEDSGYCGGVFSAAVPLPNSVRGPIRWAVIGGPRLPPWRAAPQAPGRLGGLQSKAESSARAVGQLRTRALMRGTACEAGFCSRSSGDIKRAPVASARALTSRCARVSGPRFGDLGDPSVQCLRDLCVCLFHVPVFSALLLAATLLVCSLSNAGIGPIRICEQSAGVRFSRPDICIRGL